MTRFASYAVIACLFAFAAPGALAAGDGGGTSEPAAPAIKCKKGYVPVTVKKNGQSTKICKKRQTGVMPDEELYQHGRFLAASGNYGEAIDVLKAVSNQNDPRVLNYIGYSYRKSGRLDVGIGYYQQALAINPDYVRAREYLGEGYAAAGRIDLAMVQLAEIGKRCGETCEEYQDLQEAIRTATN
ncbi:MAG: tetratricopeptide repeat protein [Aestuariivirga sp.]